jgi:hypothetical protein
MLTANSVHAQSNRQQSLIDKLMEPLASLIIVGGGTYLFVLIGRGGMSMMADKINQNFNETFNDKFDRFSTEMEDTNNKISALFERTDKLFQKMDQRLDEQNSQILALNGRMSVLENRVDNANHIAATSADHIKTEVKMMVDGAARRLDQQQKILEVKFVSLEKDVKRLES